MKFVIVLLAMAGVAMAACNQRRIREEFESFRRRYRKEYHSQAEEDYRCSVFAINFEKVEAHNVRFARGLDTHEVEINQFADLTQEEFIRDHTGYIPDINQDRSAKVIEYDPNFKAPTSVDWNAAGFVTPIKDQGRCGSCWAFATVGALESAFLIKRNTPFPAAWKDNSEQHPVECSGSYGNLACNGGNLVWTWKFFLDQKTQPESLYPYVSYDGNNGTACKYQAANGEIQVIGYTEVKSGDDAALEQAIAKGPVPVAVNAGDWSNYKGGIYQPGTLTASCTGGLLGLQLNHAVIAVGYTPEYWIIKNSWGVGWGEGGYMRLGRKFKNNCGVSTRSSYADVA